MWGRLGRVPFPHRDPSRLVGSGLPIVLRVVVAAMSMRSFMKPGVFEPEAIAAMSEAFDAACKALNDTGQPELVLEVIAQRIIAAASMGERDPVRLREAALLGLGERD